MALVTLLLGSVGVPARADGPVLHEYIPPDEREDVALRTTTVNGVLPAALDTPSGLVRAPDLQAPVSSSDAVYGGSATPGSPDARYQIDRDTSRPEAVGYDDPFAPHSRPSSACTPTTWWTTPSRSRCVTGGSRP